MQEKLLNDVVSDIAGKTGSDILKLLIGKKDVNEFLIAKKLKLTINQVRNILYKLSNYSLVTFTRKKDRKKGWYTYFWTLDNEKALELLNQKLEKEIRILKKQLNNRMSKRFYECKICKTEVGEETALLHNFTCQECGEIYVLADTKKIVRELEKSIEKLERQRKEVLNELEKIRQVREKKREREEKKEEKRKKRKKQKKRGAKMAKKKGKKKAKKKTKKKKTGKKQKKLKKKKRK